MEGRSLWRAVVPVVLIFLGLALLCNNLGVVPGLWDFIVGLWPLLLIAAGLAILLGWQHGWPWASIRRASVPFNEPLGEVRAATIELSGRAGVLTLDAASANSHDLLGGKIPEGSRAEVEVAADFAQVRFRHKGSGAWWPFGGSVGEWDLRLHPHVAWTLRVGGGVGETDLELTNLQVRDLRLDGLVGDVQVRLPRYGHSNVSIGGRVGDLTLRIPAGVAARIHRPSGSLGSSRVDTARFPLRGDVYESPDFETAADRVEVRLDSSLGDLRIL